MKVPNYGNNTFVSNPADSFFEKLKRFFPYGIGLVALLLLAVMGFVGWNYYQTQQEQKLAIAFFEIQKKGGAEVVQKLKDLEKVAPNGAFKNWIGFEIAVEPSECKDTVKNLSNRLASLNKKESLKSLAVLQAISCLKREKDFQQILKLIEENPTTNQSYLSQWLLFEKGLALSLSNQTTEAEKHWKKMLENKEQSDKEQPLSSAMRTEVEQQLTLLKLKSSIHSNN